jgi:hypothetical protein
MPNTEPSSRSWTGTARALCALAVLASVAAAAAAFPKPNPVPTRWELDFEPGALRLYVDRAEGRPYWYFTYKVVNNTGRDRIWAPALTLFTDRGEILRSGEGVPASVTRTVMDLLRNEFLEQQNAIIGEIFQGEEHALEGVVLWPAEDTTVTEMSLFISGISGETVQIQNPVSGDAVILQKTLKRDYLVPGDPVARGSTPVQFVGQEWVMR